MSVFSQESTDAKRNKAAITAAPPPSIGVASSVLHDAALPSSVMDDSIHFQTSGAIPSSIASSVPSSLAGDASLMSIPASSSSLLHGHNGSDRHDSDSAAAAQAAIRAAMRGSVSSDTPPFVIPPASPTHAATATAAAVAASAPVTPPVVATPAPSTTEPTRRVSESKGEYRAPSAGVTPPLQVVPADVTISASRNSDTPGEKFTIYVILVKWDHTNSWTVSRRFSDFVTLREKLSEHVQSLPALPSKTFMRSLASDFVSKRKADLHTFLQLLCKDAFVAQSREFQGFLEIDRNVADIGDLYPREIKSVADPQFGVNDFVYDEKDLVIFTACEDVHMLSRFDSHVSNIRFPWEKSGGCIVPIGSFNCWKLNKQGEWKATCTLFFDCQVSAVAWDAIRRYVMVALENGHIIFYFVDTTYQEFTVINELEVHQGRVTGLIYNSEQDLLISCGRDKKLNVYDLKKETTVSSGVVGNAWLSALCYDSKNNRAFVGSYSQQIYICDVSVNPPQVLHTLKGHTGSIRSLFYKKKEGYLFSGAFDGLAAIWEIAATNSDAARSKNVAWLRGGPTKKIKSICYLPSVTQVITGLESGWLAIWDTTTGKLLQVFKAHNYAVMSLKWIDVPRVLVSGGADGKIKFWKFPDMSESERKRRADKKKSSIPDKEEEIRDAQERRAILEAKRRQDAEAKVAAAKRRQANNGGAVPDIPRGAMGRKEDFPAVATASAPPSSTPAASGTASVTVTVSSSTTTTTSSGVVLPPAVREPIVPSSAMLASSSTNPFDTPLLDSSNPFDDQPSSQAPSNNPFD